MSDDNVTKAPKWMTTLHQCTQTTRDLAGRLSGLGNAAQIFGMEGLSVQLDSAHRTLQTCSEDIDRANVQAQTDRFKQAEQSSANVVNAALAGAETAKDNPAPVEYVHKLERVAAEARTQASKFGVTTPLQYALADLDAVTEEDLAVHDEAAQGYDYRGYNPAKEIMALGSKARRQAIEDLKQHVCFECGGDQSALSPCPCLKETP